ncbi:hypothetical protein CHS0354_038395 [Potamilus streckersoni]|uniref:Uncharacterized protein n=1 Tax=Potamilus streckersoni TaxID=2493646 RepID=A0AAE0S635_9BIVA|nr:hypothetical protein CHS0354_038395 [Potamilus streckersoni]
MECFADYWRKSLSIAHEKRNTIIIWEDKATRGKYSRQDGIEECRNIGDIRPTQNKSECPVRSNQKGNKVTTTTATTMGQSRNKEESGEDTWVKQEAAARKHGANGIPPKPGGCSTTRQRGQPKTKAAEAL